MLCSYGSTVITPIRNIFILPDRLYTSESDVYRRQILTYKDAPRAERVKAFMCLMISHA